MQHFNRQKKLAAAHAATVLTPAQAEVALRAGSRKNAIERAALELALQHLRGVQAALLGVPCREADRIIGDNAVDVAVERLESRLASLNA